MNASFSIVLDLWGVKKSICMKMCGALNEISEWVYIDPIKLNAAFVSAAIVVHGVHNETMQRNPDEMHLKDIKTMFYIK